MNKPQLWNLCRIAVAVVTVIIFTPLVIPSGQSEPFLFGMPYTMWMGLVVTFILLALTVLGSFVHPGRDQD